MMNLLLTGCFKYTNEQIESLHNLGYNIYYMQNESDELPITANTINATVCNGLFLTHDIDSFSELKYIQLTSAGLDRVPVNKIRERKITLYNAKGVYSIPMSEWVMFRLLEYYKQGAFFNDNQKHKQWLKNRDLKELAGTKACIIGAGNVGQEVAKRLQAFNIQVTGFDVHSNITPYFNEMALTQTLSQKISEFDIIVVTAPLLPSTYHLISKDVLENIKQNAIVINIARGGLIDEIALIDVLKYRKDLFVALDVFETEPLPETNLLWELPNVLISPHNSFVSDKNNERMYQLIYRNLHGFINSCR